MVRYREARISRASSDAALLHRLLRPDVFATHAVAYARGDDVWIAGDPLAELVLDAGRVDIDPLAALRAFLGDAQLPASSAAYGYLSFELARRFMTLPDRESAHPLLHLFVPEVEIHADRSWVTVRAISADALKRVIELVGTPHEPPVQAARSVDVHASDGGAGYMAAVEATLDAIRRRHVQKAIISRAVDVPFALDIPASYLAGLPHNSPARSFCLRIDGLEAAGYSPETVVEVSRDGDVRSQPLAGTRRRASGRDENARLIEDLRLDPKEIFEHAISVVLVQDEMRSVCTPGSVTVRPLMEVRPRGPVQHLASSVVGSLGPGRDMWDALETLFPAVTASGIPKADAIDWIGDIEDRDRGLYAGAVCRATTDGELDAALAIRTAFQFERRAWLRAGAGIVVSSTPSSEYEETCHKLRSVAPSLVPLAA